MKTKNSWLLVLVSYLSAASLEVNANVSDAIHEKCKDVADYMGCVQVFSGETSRPSKNDPLEDLRKAMLVLPSRIENTSLDGLTIAKQSFTDALALLRYDPEYADSQLVDDAKTIDIGLDHLRKLWESNIHYSVHYGGWKSCQPYNERIEQINLSLNGMALRYFEHTRFCTTQVRLEGTLASKLSRMAVRFTNGQDSGLAPFVSLATLKKNLEERKEASKAHKAKVKEMKALRKEIISIEKKLRKAEKKVEKNPSDKNIENVSRLRKELDALKDKNWPTNKKNDTDKVSQKVEPSLGQTLAAQDLQCNPSKKPAMRDKRYKQLAKAQRIIESGAPQEAVHFLVEFLETKRMNCYEAAQTWNTLAYAYYTLEDIPNTIIAYQQVLRQGSNSAPLETAALVALEALEASSQLAM